MSRRLLLCLIAAALLFGAAPAGAGETERTWRESYTAAGNPGLPEATVAAFDRAFAGDSTAEEPDRMLALISVRAARAAYRESDAFGFLSSLGFQDLAGYDIESGEHTAGHYFGVKILRLGDREIPLFAAVLRGTNGTRAEWRSNFTPGEGEVHEGFSLAAEKIGSDLEKYIESFYKTADPKISRTDFRLWITGHSRGAACGNILAARCALAPPEHIYAYLFAVPGTTKKPVAYPYIRNFNYAGDMITRLPPAEYGYGRYGLDYLNDNTEEFYGEKVARGADVDLVIRLICESFPELRDCIRAADEIFDHLNENAEKLFSLESLNLDSYRFVMGLVKKLLAESRRGEETTDGKPLTEAVDGARDAWLASDGRITKLFKLHKAYMYEIGMNDLGRWEKQPSD